MEWSIHGISGHRRGIEHDELMQDLRAHDGKRARALMVAHMKRSMEDVLTNYRSFVTREEK